VLLSINRPTYAHELTSRDARANEADAESLQPGRIDVILPAVAPRVVAGVVQADNRNEAQLV
jgi:hypothetical protein